MSAVSYDFSIQTNRYKEERKPLFEETRNRFAKAIFQLASYLNDPICKVHECYRRLHLVKILNPTDSNASHFAKKFFLWIKIALFASVTIPATVLAIPLKSLAIHLQIKPFIYSTNQFPSKTLSSEKTFSLLSWNICCVSAGYAITDGGVLPWAERIDEIARKIIEKNGDVNCLYETFDYDSAIYLSKKLMKNGYQDCYFNIGPKTIGVSSGIFVASKYKIQNPEFTPFPENSLVGRTKYASKGIFSFDLESNQRPFARIIATHLQHSEEPQFPNCQEILGRKTQMQMVVDKANSVKDRCVVVTGDLNLDDDEYDRSFFKRHFDKGILIFPTKTWGGDKFCANLTKKKVSGPLNLDHTMILKNSAGSLKTTLVETNFDARLFKKGALSDHQGLFSKIRLK